MLLFFFSKGIIDLNDTCIFVGLCRHPSFITILHNKQVELDVSVTPLLDTLALTLTLALAPALTLTLALTLALTSHPCYHFQLHPHPTIGTLTLTFTLCLDCCFRLRYLPVVLSLVDSTGENSTL